MLCSALLFEILAFVAAFSGFGWVAITSHDLAKMFYFGGPLYDLTKLLFP